ncbi:unnamed protein product [Ranitomeya imitator]|uniref:Serpin B6 n=1 Tax=Ranitomeya imitator TaxID=111125 RepID=A0ABN9L7W8_9NEOB|nr:unnamed protein product [Ranitomeya imitator]
MFGNMIIFYFQLERELTYEKFADLTNPDNMDRTEVELSLPKFKLEDYYDLESVLGALGMTDAFDMSKCDFSGMSGNRDLVLSKVFHKSFVEVNEEGTEAAAATGAVIMLRCARIVPRFTCDHPFLFFIIHKQSRAILFFALCFPALTGSTAAGKQSGDVTALLSGRSAHSECRKAQRRRTDSGRYVAGQYTT